MNNEGVGLIIAIFIIVLLASLGVIGVAMLATDVEISVATLQSSRAFYIAEAGIQDVLFRLKNDEPFRDSPTSPLTGSIAGGGFSVAISKSDDTYTLTSTGTVTDTAGASIIRRIEQIVIVTTDTLERGIHGDGSYVRFTDSSGTINGDVSCANSVANYGGMTINGTITDGDDQDNINPSLVLTTYYDEADDAGQVVANKTFSGATYTGVWYVTSKATIGDNARIEGTIICEGSVSFDGKADGILIDPDLYKPGENYPALYSGSSITSTDTGPPAQRIGLQNSSINGLVMADSNIIFDYMDNMSGSDSFNGDTYEKGFNGTLIAGNNIEMEGGSDFAVNYNEDLFSPMPPGYSYSSGVTVQPDDWKEIE